MSFKKKLAVTTIAASVAMSAFAGIPLSNKGLAEKLGVSNVVQAAAYSDFANRAQQVYSQLTPQGLANVNAFRAEIAQAIAEDPAILQPLVAKIVNPNVDSATINDLIESVLTLPIGSTWKDDYENIAKNNEGFLDKLEPGLSVDDVATVLHNMELSVAKIVGNLTLSDISDLKAIKAQLKTAATDAINSNDKFKTYANSVGITSQDLADVFTSLQDNDKVNFQTGVKAFVSLNEAYKAAFPAPTNNNPINIGGIGGFPSSSLPLDAEVAVKNLESLKTRLAEATEAQKAELIERAVKDAHAAAVKLSAINSIPSVVGNVATLSPNENNVLNIIKGIAAIADSLKSVTGEALPAVTLTLSFGSVSQYEMLISLPASIVTASADAKLAGIAVQAGKFGVEIPVGGDITGAVELKVNQAAPSQELNEQAKVVSKVFEFNLTSNNVVVDQFSNPVKVKLPVEVTNDVDTDLLTLAKIIEGKLNYYGGRYNKAEGSFVELRDTFSSYAVVENKVSFGDTEAVEAWAGRAIQVIAAKGAINGKAEGVFAPQDQVTRAEFAKMLIHALDMDNVSAKATFGDVGASEWFAPYVAAAADLGVINGRSANRFDPHAKITRAEMATMVARALKAKGAAAIEDQDAELAIFSDAGQISSSLKDGVAFAAHHGIVVGNEGKFSPNSNATRAQAAVIIYRAFNF
ncbi:hypothetical protein A7K91_21360 [Paenibacillus oryzae]|uniref:SLH domain-containing protein n=1 Tax=Paenibacillus oryzae TaxID=1844972 RepID=A0A1A5YS28_9BACL|nr:S-layer homology domain-containing protein [Paenibacillus oryzae]OBR68431.1 hypothetical protein A7K91_21360 [Paenibacillus oryzae]